MHRSADLDPLLVRGGDLPGDVSFSMLKHGAARTT